jgi:hypothetical protein
LLGEDFLHRREVFPTTFNPPKEVIIASLPASSSLVSNSLSYMRASSLENRFETKKGVADFRICPCDTAQHVGIFELVPTVQRVDNSAQK